MGQIMTGERPSQPGTRRPNRQAIGRGKRADRVLRRLAPIVGIVGVGLLWELLVRVLAVPTYLVPAPSVVMATAVEHRDTLAYHAVPTLIEAGLGFVAGNLVAVALAVLFVHSDFAERMLMPLAIFVRTVPIIAIAPVLVILFGYGLTPKVVIAGLITFFPTLVNMLTGLRAVDPSTMELMQVLSARPWEVLLRVRWFAALPYWFSALRVTVTMAVLGAIVAEWVGARRGLGYLIIQTTYDLRTPLLYAAMTVASMVALGGYMAVGMVQKRVVRWSPDAKPRI